jgi:uncharacterized protein YggE
MKKSLSITAILTAGVLALTGCSGSSGVTATGQTTAAAAAEQPQAGAAEPQVAPAEPQVGTAEPQVGAAEPQVGAAEPRVAPAAPQVAANPAADAVFAGSAVAGASVATDPAARLITAQATGTVTGTPDVVTISLGVETRSPSAQTALDENNRLATDVINVVKGKGVAPEDLQTSQLSIYPSYDDKGAVTGYQVTNIVTAKLRDIGGAGALIDAAGQAAGDAVRVQQLSFSIDDDSDLRANARADAVRRAQAQAKQLADAAGIALGPIHSITESPIAGTVVYPQAAMAADSAAGSVPIEPGSQQLQVSVQVVYEIA